MTQTNTATQTATKPALQSTFAIERVYPVAPAKVFHGFADKASKRRWFIEGEGWTIASFEMDFREGGREFSAFRFGDGPDMTSEAQYYEIIPNERLVFVYKMTIGGELLSVSLVTITFKAEGKGTVMTYVEQGTYIGGNPDDAKFREQGCRELFEALAKELAQ